MNTLPMLACGPCVPPIFVYTILGGGALVLGSFALGLICVFTRMQALGVCLVSFAVLLAAGMLAWLGLL